MKVWLSFAQYEAAEAKALLGLSADESTAAPTAGTVPIESLYCIVLCCAVVCSMVVDIGADWVYRTPIILLLYTSSFSVFYSHLHAFIMLQFSFIATTLPFSSLLITPQLSTHLISSSLHLFNVDNGQSIVAVKTAEELEAINAAVLRARSVYENAYDVLKSLGK